MLNKKLLILIAVITSLIIASSGYFYYYNLEQSIRSDKEIDLAAIARLKINQLEQWIDERYADQRIFTDSEHFSHKLEELLRNPKDEENLSYILERISIPQEAYNYNSIFLVSPDNQILLSTKENALPLNDTLFLQPYYNGINSSSYFSFDNNKINYDIISPIFNSKDQIIAFLVFRIDPLDYLYPFIQTWPTPSGTSENLLVKKEKDHVLFLNELRHQKNTALKLKIPLSQKTLPAVMAADGLVGIVEGTDYRGSDVVAYIAPVPGTDWYMVTKIDKKELFQELVSQGLYILLATVLVIIALAFGLGLFYNFKLKKQAEESNHLKTAFLANMSHEIRTPLNGILGFSSMIAEDELDQDNRKKYFEIIENSGQRLLNIVNDILDISMIQSNQIKIKNQDFILADFLKELYTFYKTIHSEKIKNLDFAMKDDSINPSLVLNSDKNRLFQIYKNLLDNALKFTQAGFIHFGAEINSDVITCFVKDSGKGIPQNKVNLIFEKFQQINPEHSIKVEGTGLGLPIAKGLVERLGGKIWLETEEEKGTTFFFTIPLN